MATVGLPVALAIIMCSLGLSLTPGDFKRVLVFPKGRKATPPDPRIRTPFGAAWTAASFKYLAEAGASSVTYGDLAPPLPELRGWRVVPCASTDPLRLAGLCAEKDGRRRLWAVSLSPEPLEVRGVPLSPFEVREL